MACPFSIQGTPPLFKHLQEPKRYLTRELQYSRDVPCKKPHITLIFYGTSGVEWF